MAFLHVETSWPCISPFGQKPCEGTLVVIGDGDSYSVACNKCNLGNTGKGPLPEFWINKLIQQGYLRQLRRMPVEKKAMRDFLAEHNEKRTLQEITDDMFEKFEIFHKDEK